jgi:hypothetical protein
MVKVGSVGRWKAGKLEDGKGWKVGKGGRWERVGGAKGVGRGEVGRGKVGRGKVGRGNDVYLLYCLLSMYNV